MFKTGSEMILEIFITIRLLPWFVRMGIDSWECARSDGEETLIMTWDIWKIEYCCCLVWSFVLKIDSPLLSDTIWPALVVVLVSAISRFVSQSLYFVK